MDYPSYIMPFFLLVDSQLVPQPHEIGIYIRFAIPITRRNLGESPREPFVFRVDYFQSFDMGAVIITVQ